MRIGIDLGGTKIEGIVLDANGDERARLRIDTPKARTRTGCRPSPTSSLRSRSRSAPPAASASPSRRDLARHRPDQERQLDPLNGHPLNKDLERLLDRPVRLENDANCFAVSEASDGAAAGCGIVFGVILGTGVGGGVVLDGRPLTGAQAIAGEWGHTPLPHPRDDERPGSRCYCGRAGCIETWLSGPRLQAEFRRRTGRDMRATYIAEAALAGDRQAGADRALLRSAGAGALGGDQHHRSARHRAGWRPVAHETALHARARAVEAVRLLRARADRHQVAAAAFRRFERRARSSMALANVAPPRGATGGAEGES
jgi:fructokinase